MAQGEYFERQDKNFVSKFSVIPHNFPLFMNMNWLLM